VISGFHHVAISTPNLPRLVRFYCDVIGFEVIFETSWAPGVPAIDAMMELTDVGAKVAMLRTGNSFLEIFEFSSPAPVPGSLAHRVVDYGLTHICLNVTDVAAECARLSAAGMRLHTQPISIGLPITGTYGRDPDGNIIELLEVLDENFALHMSKRYLASGNF